ncbi:MAG: hypothetical protein HY264_10260 [Chloroflexi bacterium]|nr:hypothetical protein [Chloroflexota bacterium]
MSGTVRRAGRFPDDAGRVVTWSVADGVRGRRWRWTVVDRRGALVVVHTLETDPAGRFLRLESASAADLLTLHREPDGSLHGNRVSERGVDHLTVEPPVPEGLLIGATWLGVAILLGSTAIHGLQATLDVLELSDDLGLRIASATVRSAEPGTWDVRTNRQACRAQLDPDGLPRAGGADSASWPLELS